MGKTINIKVVAGAKKNMVKEENGLLKVYTTAPAVEGKANKAVIKIISEHFSIRKSGVKIIKGLKSRDKIVIIDG